MNVAYDDWIPVVTTEGTPELASLCSVMTEGGKYADLAVRPHERVALMRLFLCVAHAAIKGPKDYDEWLSVPKRLPKAAKEYLEDWEDSFELFHPQKPWLQVAEISKDGNELTTSADPKDWTPVSKLTFSYATGNNTTLFDHNGMNEDRRISIPDRLLSMLAFQCFSTGGLISQVFWNGKKTKKTSKDAPCVTASMVHALIRGKNLSESIHCNLPTYEDIIFSYGEHEIGRPVWEQTPQSLDDSPSIQNATTTYIGRLVPMCRVIQLHPTTGRMLFGDGLVYPIFTDGFPQEPTATVVIRKKTNKEEKTILSYRPSRALWRELGAILVKRKAEGIGGPLSLRSLQEAQECDLVVGAMARDQANIVDTSESVFRISARLQSPGGIIAYESEVKKAEDTASRLGRAIEEYRSAIDDGWKGRLKNAGKDKGNLKAKLHGIATAHYWTAVEKNLALLMTHIDAIGTDNAEPTRNAWRKMLFTSASNAYRIACGQETPRQIKAFVEGWKRLFNRKKETEISK